jgi:hypothetical protein
MKKPGQAPSVTQNIGSVISHTSMAYELPWITNHRIWQLNELLNFALGVGDHKGGCYESTHTTDGSGADSP